MFTSSVSVTGQSDESWDALSPKKQSDWNKNKHGTKKQFGIVVRFVYCLFAIVCYCLLLFVLHPQIWLVQGTKNSIQRCSECRNHLSASKECFKVPSRSGASNCSGCLKSLKHGRCGAKSLDFWWLFVAKVKLTVPRNAEELDFNTFWPLNLSS